MSAAWLISNPAPRRAAQSTGFINFRKHFLYFFYIHTNLPRIVRSHPSHGNSKTPLKPANSGKKSRINAALSKEDKSASLCPINTTQATPNPRLAAASTVNKT